MRCEHSFDHRGFPLFSPFNDVEILESKRFFVELLQHNAMDGTPDFRQASLKSII